MAQYQLVHFNLNGKDVERMVDVRASLTDMLRNDYHMTSVKKGCEVGECGACNVIIDGECFNSCIYLAVWAEGKRIRTLESLMGPNGELSDIQQAFIEETAVQCGFCTPGFIMTAVEILESGKLYTDAELRKLLSGHLCLCGIASLSKDMHVTVVLYFTTVSNLRQTKIRPKKVRPYGRTFNDSISALSRLRFRRQGGRYPGREGAGYSLL